ncbi:MAG: hypothetical protein QM778_33890 [Myxococcales bacterium]
MNRWFSSWLLVGLLGVISGAEAQDNPGTNSPSVERASSSAAASTGSADYEKEPEPWKGPKVDVSYRLYSLHDWQGGGIVNSAAFSGFLPTRYFRGGGGVEGGTRAYHKGDSEGLISGHLFAGYQHIRDLGRLVPYLVAMGEAGFTFGKRFHTPLSRGFRGIGAELGADVQLVKGFHVGVGVSFMVYTMDDLRYDTFGMRLSVGL